MKSYGCRQCFCPSHPLSTAFWEKVDIHSDFNSREVLMLTLSLQNAILKAFPGTGSYWQGVIDQYCTYNQWLADFCLLLLFYLIIRQTMWSLRGMTICGDDRGWWRGSSWQGHQDETFIVYSSHMKLFGVNFFDPWYTWVAWLNLRFCGDPERGEVKYFNDFQISSNEWECKHLWVTVIKCT